MSRIQQHPIIIARKTRYYNDPTINKYAYAILVNLTSAQKELLNSKELYSIRDRTAIRSFAHSVSQERIDILLTKVGIKVARVYYAPDKLNAQVAKMLTTSTAWRKPLQVVEDIHRQNFFVVAERDIAHSLSMMSMNCHSGPYEHNL